MQPERLGDLRLALRLEVFGTGGRNESGLGETLILEGGALAHELGAGGRQLLLGLERLDLDIGVGEVEQNGLRLHALPRLREHPIDAAGGERRDEADVFRDERTGPPNLTHHFAAAHRIDPQSRSVHGRCGGLQAREKNREEDDRAGGDAALEIAAVFRYGRAGNVQTNPRSTSGYTTPARSSGTPRANRFARIARMVKHLRGWSGEA